MEPKYHRTGTSPGLLSKIFPSLERDQDKWVQVLYSEIWKQLSHQDQVANSRANIFLAVQAGLFAILLLGSPRIWGFGCLELTHFDPALQLHLGSMLLGIIWVFLGILLLLQGRYFLRVTEAGEQYVRFRHAHLRALEQLTVGNLGPALSELQWRQHSKKCKQKYRPFASLKSECEEIRAVAATEVDAFNHFGGYPYLYHLHNLWQKVYWIVLIAGLVAFFLGLAISIPPTHFEIKIKGLEC